MENISKRFNFSPKKKKVQKLNFQIISLRKKLIETVNSKDD